MRAVLTYAEEQKPCRTIHEGVHADREVRGCGRVEESAEGPDAQAGVRNYLNLTRTAQVSFRDM